MMRKYFILITLIVANICLLGLTQRERISQALLAEVQSILLEQLGWKVHCNAIHFSFPLQLQLDEVTVEEDGNPQLQIKQILIQVDPWSAIRRRLIVEAITMDSVSLLHLPTSEGTHASKWPSLNYYLRIKAFGIHGFTCAPEVKAALHLPENLPPVSLQGHAVLDYKNKEALIDILLFESHQPTHQTHVVWSLTEGEGILNGQMRLEESPHGILAGQLNIPHEYSWHAYIKVKGTPDAWLQLIQDNSSLSETVLFGDLQCSYEYPLQAENKLMYPLLQEYGSIKSNFKFSEKTGIHFSEISGMLGDVLFNGQVNIDAQQQCDGTSLQLSMHDSAAIQTWLGIDAQQVFFDCQITGDLLSPHAGFQMHSNYMAAFGYPFEHVMAKGTLFRFHDQIAGHLEANGEYLKKKMHASSAFSWNNGEWLHLPNLTFHCAGTEFQGDLQINPQLSLFTGDLRGNCDLHSLGSDLSGHITLAAQSTYENSHSQTAPQQILTLQLEGNAIQMPDWTIPHSDLHIIISSPFQEPHAALKCSGEIAPKNSANRTKITLETTLDGESSYWPYLMTYDNNNSQNSSLESKGYWHASKDSFQLHLEDLAGHLGTYPIKLHEAMLLELSSHQILITPMQLSLGNGYFYSTCQYKENFLHTLIDMHDIPLEIMQLMQPSWPIQGLAFAHIDLISNGQEIIGDLNLDARDILIRDDVLSMPMPLQANFNAHLNTNFLECTGMLSGIGPHPFDISAHLPVTFSLSPPFISLDTEQSLLGHLGIEGRIEGFLDYLLPLTDPLLTGKLKGEIDVSGTLAAPQISGYADISEGKIEILAIGAAINNCQAHLELNGTEIMLTELTASEGESNKVTGKGRGEISTHKHMPFTLELDLTQLSISPNGYSNMASSGRIFIEGNSQEAKVMGQLTADSAQFTIPQQLSELSQDITIRYINQPDDLPLPTIYTPPKSSWPIALDLHLAIPGNGMINGNNLSSLWKGDVCITGTTYHPLVHGALQVIQGEYRISGKPFQIHEGTISFAGEKTSLYVIANRDIEDIKAELILKGPLKHPAITFRSNPPMSQREIVSWILFNQGTSEITPFQGTQLNDSITDLTSGNQQPDLLTRIREGIGIDRIEINHDSMGSQGVSVNVGKYISQGVMVSINKSISTEANRLGIEANVIKNVKVQAQLGDDHEAQLLLKWKHDY